MKRVELVTGTYTGEVNDEDLPHGRGTLVLKHGGKCEGEFVDGELNGQGTYYYATGNKYVGSFANGKRHGYGSLTWARGETYEGDFEDDLRTGLKNFFFFFHKYYFKNFWGKKDGECFVGFLGIGMKEPL